LYVHTVQQTAPDITIGDRSQEDSVVIDHQANTPFTILNDFNSTADGIGPIYDTVMEIT
jgi:hypothetical protein